MGILGCLCNRVLYRFEFAAGDIVDVLRKALEVDIEGIKIGEKSSKLIGSNKPIRDYDVIEASLVYGLGTLQHLMPMCERLVIGIG